MGKAPRVAHRAYGMGTLGYMSPEQIQGQAVGARTDLFAAGVVLYQFLTGRRPFAGGALFEVQRKILQDPPTPPSQLNPGVPVAFDTIVSRALAKKAGDRYDSAASFAAALRDALAQAGPTRAGNDDEATVVFAPGATGSPATHAMQATAAATTRTHTHPKARGTHAPPDGHRRGDAGRAGRAGGVVDNHAAAHAGSGTDGHAGAASVGGAGVDAGACGDFSECRAGAGVSGRTGTRVRVRTRVSAGRLGISAAADDGRTRHRRIAAQAGGHAPCHAAAACGHRRPLRRVAATHAARGRADAGTDDAVPHPLRTLTSWSGRRLRRTAYSGAPGADGCQTMRLAACEGAS